MRRALLLATLLAVPVLGSAQTAGTITFTNTDADPRAASINFAECVSSTARVAVNWLPTGTLPTGTATYQMYASNKDTAPAAGASTECPTTSNDSTGLKVVKVGGLLTNPSRASIGFSTREMAAALATTQAPDPCAGSGTTKIYLCIEGASGGANFGQARGSINLALTRPDAAPELLLPIAPGNTALTPRWSDSATNTTNYEVRVISVADPAQLPTAGAFDPAGPYTGFDPLDRTRHGSGFVTGSEVRVSGLRNGVTYAVMVTSFTEDFNPGDPSNVASGAPQFTKDFWDSYKDAGGPENGGCASGVAGPLGLLLLAGTLALVRRRK